MRVRWTPASADDLEEIADYLTLHFPSFRQKALREIWEAIAALRSLPYRGRIGRDAGTRELVMAGLPYIVVYRIKGDAVEILHIFHGAQERP
ncbi:MAG TPA: type II toxin-antitoxin system RelE/ParE family toxin [Terracidiphilus sp.]|jgi:plasmid stabilization system protein ParE|nr:type II toxin-antitoxin system RelE/ParE family toxin [Terracidiphilus sp.]